MGTTLIYGAAVVTILLGLAAFWQWASPRLPAALRRAGAYRAAHRRVRVADPEVLRKGIATDLEALRKEFDANLRDTAGALSNSLANEAASVNTRFEEADKKSYEFAVGVAQLMAERVSMRLDDVATKLEERIADQHNIARRC